ncbi:hypothetical protein [Sinorhizobium meliloti]|uniref:hypothetical protein n=1 Tax=Rhizobium meliloti TaxID=382 RepID=UPI000FE06D52|nr:hypothetical protein [Sinorhizobium meliloti]RVG70891.1 hypothetical protein CN222_01775 [Sinorhizobium meliloti]
MGAMKEWLLAEQEMQDEEPFWDYEVSFLCPVCGHPGKGYMVTPVEDGETVEEISCLNPEDEHSWSVRIIQKNASVSARLDGQPGVPVSVYPAGMPDEWDEPAPEPGAHGIFLKAMGEWRDNVEEIARMDGLSSRNRMLFITLYSIVEAYFADAIIGAAQVDTNLQRQMLKLKSLKDKQITLATVLDKPTIVRDMVKVALQALSFHDLKQVSWISEKSFNKSILPKDKDDRKLILMSVGKRHDCVHRNGRDKDGNQHDDISSAYLKKIGTIFEGMAEALEDAIRDAQAKIFFEDLGPEQVQPGQSAA